MASDIGATRDRLQAIAQEINELAKTYEPSQPGVFGHQAPAISKAMEFINEAQNSIDNTMFLFSATYQTCIRRTLIQLGVFDKIPLNGCVSLHDLSKASNATPELIERLLRVELASGLIHQDDEGNYSHTRLSKGYTANALATGLFRNIFDRKVQELSLLPEFLEHQRQATGKLEEVGASRDNTLYNLVTWKAGVEGQKHTFEVLEEQPEQMKRFQKHMDSSRHVSPYVGYYDFSKLATDDPDRAVLVDVGGGHGHSIAAILAAHSAIKPEQCVLQDMAGPVAYAESDNDKLPKGVQFQVHNFFDRQPVHGARAYYMRAIAHDLSDANLVRLLQQITPVMAADSKILIAENIFPERGMLPLGTLMDITMLCIGGKERTERNFREVLEKAGLEVDGVHMAGGKLMYGIIEASLR